jgi:hypothetical protein
MRTGPNFQITAPTNGQTLSYNGTAWVNGSGGGGPVTKRVASNLSYAASTTITDFTFAAAANTTYLVQGVLVVDQSNQTGVNIDVDGPSGFTADGFLVASIDGFEKTRFDETGTTSAMTNGIDNGAGVIPCSIFATIRTSSTAGDVSFDIATSSGSGTNSLLANSCITITTIS